MRRYGELSWETTVDQACEDATKIGLTPWSIAQCQGQEVGLDVMTSSVRYGQLPADKMVLVSAWVALRREDILASWHAGRVTGDYLQLAPLR